MWSDEIRNCPTCGHKYSSEVNYCPEDGTPLGLPLDDPLIGTVLMGQFEIRERCGSGSMGTVYRAWQPTMERAVAVKLLRADLLGDDVITRRFYREARAAARLSHPNIIPVYLVGKTEDSLPFILMEFVSGQSLAEICERSAPLATDRAVRIALQIASALAEAHANGIIHRDLKPANILVTHHATLPDHVKVVDFGIAKILRDSGESQLSRTGTIFGTPYYLSPEQASGLELDHRCDLYSLGVILFEMVTGRLPFTGQDGIDVLLQHIERPPPLPSDIAGAVPAQLDFIILKALAKDRAERWPDAAALHVALDALLLELRSHAATPPSKTTPSSRPISKWGSGNITLPPTLREPSGDRVVPPTRHVAPTPPTSVGQDQTNDTLWIKQRLLRRHVALSLLLALGAALAVAVAAMHWTKEVSPPPPPQIDSKPSAGAPQKPRDAEPERTDVSAEQRNARSGTAASPVTDLGPTIKRSPSPKRKQRGPTKRRTQLPEPRPRKTPTTETTAVPAPVSPVGPPPLANDGSDHGP